MWSLSSGDYRAISKAFGGLSVLFALFLFSFVFAQLVRLWSEMILTHLWIMVIVTTLKEAVPLSRNFLL